MSLPRELPMPGLPDTKNPASLERFHVKLKDTLVRWTGQASTELGRMVLQPTPLNEPADGARTTFTIQGLIDAILNPDHVTSTAKAQLVADGKVLPYSVVDPPPAGTWTLRETAVDTQELVLGTAPVVDVHLGFFVARIL